MISKRKSLYLYIFHFEYDRINELLNEKKLLDIDLRVYTFLCRQANEENDSCDPTKEYIAGKLNKDPETIRKSINRLCEYNFIQKVETKDSKKIPKTNIYFILDLESRCLISPHRCGGETDLCPKNESPEKTGSDSVIYTNNINHNNITHNDNVRMCDDDFSLFWNEYPKRRHEDKQLTKLRFMKLDKKLLPAILDTLEKQKQTSEWKKDNCQYVPQPAKWLKNKRWEDEIQPLTLDEEIEQTLERYKDEQDPGNAAFYTLSKKYPDQATMIYLANRLNP